MFPRTAVALAFLAMAARAGAAPRHETAAVAAIDAGPRVPAYQIEKAKQTIEQGLAAAGYAIVHAAAPTGGLAPCRHGDCVREVARGMAADAIVFASISYQDESAVIDLTLFDGASAQQVAAVHEVCDLCGEAELDDHLGVAASALRAQAAEAASRAARIDAELRARPPRNGSPVPGIALAAGGLAAIGLGAYLWSLDGKGTCHAGDTPVYPAPGAAIRYDPDDPDVFVCRDIYKTRLAGLSTIGAGVLATALGVTWFAHSRGRRRAAIEVAPTPVGATVGAVFAW